MEISARFIDLGSAHDSELPYLFQINPDTGRPSQLTRSQRELAVQMGRYWGRFARTGNPNGRGTPKWSRWTKSSTRVHSLQQGRSRSLAASAFGEQHQCDYWNPLLNAVAGGE